MPGFGEIVRIDRGSPATLPSSQQQRRNGLTKNERHRRRGGRIKLTEDRDLNRLTVSPLHGGRTPSLQDPQRSPVRHITSPDLDDVVTQWNTENYSATTYLIERLRQYRDGRTTPRSRLDHVSIGSDGAPARWQSKAKPLG